MGRPLRAWLDGSLRRRHHSDVFRPDLASLPNRACRSDAGSASHIDPDLGVKTHDGESLAGMQIRSVGAKAEGAPTLVGFGGNAWNAWTMALTLHALFPDRDVVTFHYRGYAPSSGRRSENAVLSDSLVIFDHLRQTQADEPIIAVGFSIGSAVAAYLARHRPVVGLILARHSTRSRPWPAISTGGLLSACFSTIVCPRSSSFAARSRSRPSSLRSATKSCRRGAARPCVLPLETLCLSARSTLGTTTFLTVQPSLRRCEMPWRGLRRVTGQDEIGS